MCCRGEWCTENNWISKYAKPISHSSNEPISGAILFVSSLSQHSYATVVVCALLCVLCLPTAQRASARERETDTHTHRERDTERRQPSPKLNPFHCIVKRTKVSFGTPVSSLTAG